MVENHRTGFVWEIFMKNSEAHTAMQKVGFRAAQRQRQAACCAAALTVDRYWLAWQEADCHCSGVAEGLKDSPLADGRTAGLPSDRCLPQ